VKFEELYTDANMKVDEIAERILTLGKTPLHTFEDYSNAAKVPIGKNISLDENAVKLIVDSLTELLKIERQILDASDDANDEGTNAMMSDFITEQEKTVWMMKAWLGESV
jgi:starvation-inducible DNA-binding protein